MIHFDRIPEPEEFDNCARVPGCRWLDANVHARRPKDYWTPFKSDLADGFRCLCAYSAMYEPVGTVDHFVSWDEDKSKAYEWDNYRYCAAWINSSKQNAPSDDLLDPFVVKDGWFKVILPSLQLTVADCVPRELRTRAEYTLKKLHLVHDERVLRQRDEWYRMYLCEELTLDGLRRKAPLIAAAVAESDT